MVEFKLSMKISKSIDTVKSSEIVAAKINAIAIIFAAIIGGICTIIANLH